jgi:hypothetical protein
MTETGSRQLPDGMLARVGYSGFCTLLKKLALPLSLLCGVRGAKLVFS